METQRWWRRHVRLAGNTLSPDEAAASPTARRLDSYLAQRLSCGVVRTVGHQIQRGLRALRSTATDRPNGRRAQQARQRQPAGHRPAPPTASRAPPLPPPPADSFEPATPIASTTTHRAPTSVASTPTTQPPAPSSLPHIILTPISSYTVASALQLPTLAHIPTSVPATPMSPLPITIATPANTLAVPASNSTLAPTANPAEPTLSSVSCAVAQPGASTAVSQIATGQQLCPTHGLQPSEPAPHVSLARAPLQPPPIACAHPRPQLLLALSLPLILLH